MGVLNPHSRAGVPGGSGNGRGGVGTVVAIIVALCFVGLIGTLVLRAQLGGPKSAGAETVPPPTPGPLPADSGRIIGYNIEIADKADPTRVAFRLKADAADPAGNGRHRLTRPEAWAYLKDGHVVYVRADQGQVYVPVENRPESGTITGNVEVTLYRPGADGKTGSSMGVFKTRSLTFDTSTLEISTLDPFTIEGESLTARGEGLKALFNEVRQRIEYLQITRGNSVTFTPKPGDDTPTAARPPATAANAARPPAPGGAAPPEPSVETIYQLVLNDEVRVVQIGRTLTADRVDAWVRLVNNQLPPNAIASLSAAPPPPGAPGKAAAPRDPATPRRAPAAANPTQSPDPAPVSGDGPVTLTWAGPCTLRPLDSAPAELGTDHAFLRATAEKTGLVTFRDDGMAGGGQCAALEYGLTTGVLALSGPGPTSVSLALDDGSSLETARAAFDLRKLTGLVPGPGIIRGAAEEGGDRPQIAWATRAAFALARAVGERSGVLRSADFVGRVFASDGRASVRAETLRAEFERDADGNARLSRVVADDKNRVTAQSGADRRMQAEHIDLAFGPGESARRPLPMTLLARGRIEATDRGADLACGYLEAELIRDEDGGTTVRRAAVRENVAFARAEDGLSAAADEAKVDAQKQIVDLSGPDAFVQTLSSSGPTRVGGPQIHIEGIGRTIAVFGPWTIDHGEPDANGKAPSHAQGTSGLTFDDRTGKAEGAGDVRLTHRPDALTTDTMQAERVRLEFTPRPEDPPAGSNERPRPLDRKLVRAEAIGGVLEHEGGANATVESRRYAEGAGERRLIQLLYAEGPRIVADDSKGTLDIPAAGLLALRDHEAPPPAAPGEKPSDFRGDTRFDWDGSMHFDRNTGAAEMERNVRITHLRLADKQAVSLVAEHVAAKAKAREGEGGGGSAAAADRFDLVSASAKGAVYVAVGPWTDPPTPPTRELAADAIDYDAATGMLLATANPGNLVTVFDSTRATPASAERVTWNIATGQIELQRAQPVVVPR